MFNNKSLYGLKITQFIRLNLAITVQSDNGRTDYEHKQYINDEILAYMQKTATYPVPNDLSQSSICLEVAL